MAFLDALRGRDDDAIRQSTSLTMAYLLEQNRKFEAYMRQKVAELEARVAGQQARLELSRLELSPLPVEEETDDLPAMGEPAETTDWGAEFSDLAGEAAAGPETVEDAGAAEAPGGEAEAPPVVEASPVESMSVTAEEWTSLWGLIDADAPAAAETGKGPDDGPAGDVAAATPEAEEDGEGDELFVPGHALAGQKAVAAASKVETPPGQPSGAARPDLEAPGEEDEDGGGEWDRRLAATGGPVEEYA